MSNYQVKAKKPEHEIMAGWDQAMLTYFAHVIDTSKAEDEPGRDVLWVGTTPYEIMDVEIVINKLNPYVEYDQGDLVMALYTDANI